MVSLRVNKMGGKSGEKILEDIFRSVGSQRRFGSSASRLMVCD